MTLPKNSNILIRKRSTISYPDLVIENIHGFLFQRVVQCPPCIRANIDVIIAFGAVAFPELDALHNMASVTNRKQFKKMFYKITNEKYSFLVMRTYGGRLSFYHNFDREIFFSDDMKTN